MLELHLHEVSRFVIAWHVSKPVISVQLLVLSAYCPSAKPSVSRAAYLVILVIYVHIYINLQFIIHNL